MGNQFEGMDPNEIQFITQPFWLELEKRINENADYVYTITIDDDPVAVIVSPILVERMKEDLQVLCDRLNETRAISDD